MTQRPPTAPRAAGRARPGRTCPGVYDAVSARLAARAGVARRAPVRRGRLRGRARAARPRLRARHRHRAGSRRASCPPSTGCRCSPTPTPATATRCRRGAPPGRTPPPASPGCTSRTRSPPSAAATSPASRSSTSPRRPPGSGPRSRPATGLVVVARTDALGVEGVDVRHRALRRVRRGRRRRAVRRGRGPAASWPGWSRRYRAPGCPPLVRQPVRGGRRRAGRRTGDALRELGVRLVIHPVSALLAAARAQAAVYAAIVAPGDAGARRPARLGRAHRPARPPRASSPSSSGTPQEIPHD